MKDSRSAVYATSVRASRKGVKPEVGTGVVCIGTAFPPCQCSKWATCPGSAEPTGGGFGLGRVLQPGALLDDSLFLVTGLAASAGNRHHLQVIGSVDVEQGEWELCQPKLLDPRHIQHGWIAPSPASRRPIGAQLGAPNSRASGLRLFRTLHQTVSRAAPEAPMGLRRYERAVGNAVPPIPPKTAKNQR